MAIDTQDKLIEALAGSSASLKSSASFTTITAATYLANRFTGHADGIFAGGAARAAGGSIITKADVGFQKYANAPAGKDNYIVGASYYSSAQSNFFWVDILYSVSGFSSTVTTFQPVTAPPALTRYTNGIGNKIYILGLVVLGATATNITVTYTNQDGVTGKTTVPRATAALAAGRMWVDLVLADGDTGVLAIEGVQFSASSGTAGNLAVMIVHPLTPIGGVGIGGSINQDFAAVGLPKIGDNAALGRVLTAGATSSGVVTTSLNIGAA